MENRQNDNQQRREHAAKRADAVVRRYLADHPGSVIGAKVESGGLTLVEAYTLLKEIGQDQKTGIDRADLLTLTVEYEIEGAMKNAWPLSLAVIDIDDFKVINSELTHVGADVVLHEVATILRRGVRDSDDVLAGENSIVRWGGEEFIVLLVGTDTEGATAVAERLRQAIARELHGCRPSGADVTVSIGVASWDAKVMKDWTDLVQLADTRLFRAKKNGKNQVVGI